MGAGPPPRPRQLTREPGQAPWLQPQIAWPAPAEVTYCAYAKTVLTTDATAASL